MAASPMEEGPLKNRLIWKLLLINLTVIGFVLVIVWLSIDTLAAGYFVTLMERYKISPEPAHDMFVSAIHRYLLWAFLAAVVLAIVLSFVLMRRALSPLTQMTVITRKIASGDFSVRVPVGTMDELPLVHERADLVYDGRATDVRAWIWDVAADESGHPVIVYTRLPADDEVFAQHSDLVFEVAKLFEDSQSLSEPSLRRPEVPGATKRPPADPVSAGLHPGVVPWLDIIESCEGLGAPVELNQK